MKVPPICVDLNLCEYFESFGGCLNSVSDKKHLKYVEETHQSLHKEHKSHIHLDGSFDKG